MPTHLCVKVLLGGCPCFLLLVLKCGLKLCLHVLPHSSISSSNRLQESFARVEIMDACSTMVAPPVLLDHRGMVVKVGLQGHPDTSMYAM